MKQLFSKWGIFALYPILFFSVVILEGIARATPHDCGWLGCWDFILTQLLVFPGLIIIKALSPGYHEGPPYIGLAMLLTYAVVCLLTISLQLAQKRNLKIINEMIYWIPLGAFPFFNGILFILINNSAGYKAAQQVFLSLHVGFIVVYAFFLESYRPSKGFLRGLLWTILTTIGLFCLNPKLATDSQKFWREFNNWNAQYLVAAMMLAPFVASQVKRRLRA